MKAALIGLGLSALTLNGMATVKTDTIKYTQNGTNLIGYIAYDNELTAKGKAPGILVIHEWWGLNDFVKQKAEELARMGYVAFAVDMYGDGQVTKDPDQAKRLAGQMYGNPSLMVERAQAGLDQLLKTGLVDNTKIASIGFCFGGTCSLALAYSGAPVQAVVTFHGGLTPAPSGTADKTKAKFLILHGALDPLVNKGVVDSFLASMNEAKLDYQFVIYSGAVHAFTNPDADKAREAGLPGVGYNAQAAKRAWRQMKLFFDEVFVANNP